MSSPFASIEETIAAIKAGKMIILLDAEDRENEGDLVIAAEFATPKAINFMAKYGRGLICLPMEQSLIARLNLPLMARENRSPYGTAFTVSIEAKTGVTTGISAQDRARTIAVAIGDDTTADDVITPGHLFPLVARPKGVLERQGQTEGSVDLARLAGLKPAAVICEIINEDGTMSRRDELLTFAKEHDLLVATIKDLIDYRIQHETLISEEATTRLPVAEHGEFTMTVYANALDNAEHFTLYKKPRFTNQIPLVRIHSECLTGDVLGSQKCDCGQQLQQSLALLAESGGLLIYLRQEGRGIGLANKLKAYTLQEQGFDTVDANLKLGFPADNRDYAVAYQILKHWGIESLRLITNNPEKVKSLQHFGLEVTERVPLLVQPGCHNQHYLKTKQEKLGHLLTLE